MTKQIKDEFENDSFLNDVNRILNMTNKEAAEVLEKVKIWMNTGRRNGKTRLSLAYNKAIEKAITALRKDVLYVCDRTRCENCSAKDEQCFMTSEITHASNFIDAGDGIYVEKTPAEWIPVSERLPDDLEPVNITYVNHNPESYYDDIKDKPFTATGVYFKDNWYWWSTLCEDFLKEYGVRYMTDRIDDDVEVIAWMVLPNPYKSEV